MIMCFVPSHWSPLSCRGHSKVQLPAQSVEWFLINSERGYMKLTPHYSKSEQQHMDPTRWGGD